MRGWIKQRDSKFWRTLLSSISIAVMLVGIILLIRDMFDDECDCGLCDLEDEDEDEFCDENGCCYTDEKNFV
jgi:hypothetical protein